MNDITYFMYRLQQWQNENMSKHYAKNQEEKNECHTPMKKT